MPGRDRRRVANESPLPLVPDEHHRVLCDPSIEDRQTHQAATEPSGDEATVRVGREDCDSRRRNGPVWDVVLEVSDARTSESQLNASSVHPG